MGPETDGDVDHPGERAMVGDSLDILLIEDNPGDARLIREMIEPLAASREGGGDLPLEATTDGVGAELETTLRHADRLGDGLDRLADEGADLVLLDLNLPDSRGLDTLDAVVEHAPRVPVVVLTGMDDREMGLNALDRGAREYFVKDEINADLLVRTVFHAIQRERYERELERQHERLSMLYGIGQVVQGIVGSVVDHSTTAEIEAAVVDRLTAAEAYEYAWIGEVDQPAGRVRPRTEAVPDGFFEGWEVSLAERNEDAPISTATLTEELQLVNHAEEEPAYGDWHAEEFDYRSVAVVPIRYEEALYGVLVVYSARADAFEDEEQDIVTQLGAFVGHAMNAVERKAALMGDAAVELDLLLPDVVEYPGGSAGDGDRRIAFLTTVPAGDGSYLQYASVSGFDEAELSTLFGQFPSFTGVREIENRADDRLVEIRYTDPPIVSTIATHGGRFLSATIEDGDYAVTVELPSDADVRSFVESIRETYPDVDLVAQRSGGAGGDAASVGFDVSDPSLTDKQRAALEAAYFAGYFDQPRTSTGEEIAESLGVTASTFHQHLQAGLRKVLAGRFEGADRAAADRR